VPDALLGAYHWDSGLQTFMTRVCLSREQTVARYSRFETVATFSLVSSGSCFRRKNLLETPLPAPYHDFRLSSNLIIQAGNSQKCARGNDMKITACSREEIGLGWEGF